MKKFSKKTAITLTVILSIVLVIGLIFSFVPMKFGDKTWTSFSKSINISSDIVGGVYGEFDISTENPSNADIEKSKTIIRKVMANNGYKNANVYSIANEKIRVEVSYPKGSTTFSDVVSSINIVSNGTFALLSRSKLDESDSGSKLDESGIVVKGCDSIDNVVIVTNDSSIGLTINFTKAGEELFKNLCNKVASSGSIYIAIGSSNPISYDVSSVISNGDFSSLSLGVSSYSALESLRDQVEIGSMPIEFNSNTIIIDTMSASMTAGECASSPEFSKFFSSSTYNILVATVLFALIVIITIFAINFGYYAIMAFISMLFNCVLSLIMLNLIPSFELGLSGFVAITICISLIYMFAFDFAFEVKKQYNNGKTINAALEFAFKSKASLVAITNITLFLASLTFVLLSFGELFSVGVIFSISSALSLLTNLLVMPMLIKIALSFAKRGSAIFKLKKRAIGELGTIETNEEEAI